jgi:hypothetical protein
LVHIFKCRTVRKWIMKRDVHTHTQNVFLMVRHAQKLLRDVPEDTGFLTYKDAMIREMKKQASCVCVCVCVCVCLQVHMHVFPIACTLFCYIMMHGSTVIM